MKANKVFLLLIWMVSAWSFQCSGSDDAADALSLPPSRPSDESPDATPEAATPDSTPEGSTDEVKIVPTLYDNGYANFHNARLTISSLNLTVSPEFQYVLGCFDGSDNPMVKGNAYSDILLYTDGIAYVGIPPDYSCSLLYEPGYYGDPFIYHWDLEYALVRQAGQPDEIILSGTGRGSHIYEIPYDAWVKSEIAFEFRGVLIEGTNKGTNSFEGNFTLEERSPEEKYNLSLSGAATLEWKQEGE